MTMQRAHRLLRTTYYSAVMLMFALTILTVALLKDSSGWIYGSYAMVVVFALIGGIALGLYDSADQSDKEKAYV